ncbi:MAG: MmgE/PrpD family protein [Actinobacteria bacterium]|nr:MmgE/PrpD family protein [Actinomycetota bacterium]
MNYTQRLAQYASNLKYEDVPTEVIGKVKVLLQDYISVAFGGMQTESGKIVAEFAKDFNEKGKCTVIGWGYKSAPYNAAFANAIMAHSIELDDADVDALFHYGVVIVPAALAAAEWVDTSGKEFLTSLMVGCDVITRISEATNPSLRNRGYHTTPTCGVFGAGAASGRVMKLNEDKMVSVLGLSGAQASGLMEMYGPSMAKRFNPGPAARNGITAALFAERGFTGAETILEGERGFCRAFSDEYDLERLTAGLGEDFRIFIEYKPYACARPIHNAIDCALEIRNKYSPVLEEISSILVKRHPDWAHYHSINEPRTYHEAQMSLPYSVAVALVEGRAFYDQYSEENLKRSEIMRLCRMVEIEPDATLLRGVSCRMIIGMKDGRKLEALVDYPKGSPQNPMTEEERYTKFEDLSSKVLNDSQRQNIIEKISNMEEIEDIKAFTSLLS